MSMTKEQHAARMRAYRARKRAQGFTNMTHGTTTGYTVGCRCEACVTGWQEHRRAYRARKQAEGFAGLEHGTIGTYGLGCRCDPCLGAQVARHLRTVAKRRAS